MSDKHAPSEFLVISKGQWDADKPPEVIQKAIDAFYVWHDKLVSEGKMRSGQRLAPASMFVSRHGVTDGPFTETKEVIGGYWFFIANSLEEAAALAAQNPCMAWACITKFGPLILLPSALLCPRPDDRNASQGEIDAQLTRTASRWPLAMAR